MPSLNFKGKVLVHNHHLGVPFSELEPVKSKGLSKTPSLHDNLIVEGDNLRALKALLPIYHGKVKCIYIDPPYNTGNESWIYNDKVNSPMIRDWLGKTVDRDDLTRHDKWCCMMLPRLKLLREFLTDDGAIFVSIDDNEVHHLRALMDEVFGEECYKNTIAVRRGTKNVQSQFESVDRLSVGHEYVLFYTRKAGLRLDKLQNELEESEVGKWDTFWRGTDRPSMRYSIFEITPDTGQWRWEKERGKLAKENYENYLREVGDKLTLDDYYLSHLTATNQKLDFVRLSIDGVVQYFVPPRSYKLMSDNWMDVSIRGNFTKFDTEKGLGLMERILTWYIGNDSDATVLDSFAGSGTTAHAVLALNKEDGGNRRFILCQMPYETKEQEEKKQNICDTVTAERVRRVIKGVPGAKDENLREGYGGTFSYFRIGHELRKQAILDGHRLPSYEALAGYVFFTATGDEFDSTKMKPPFIGSSRGRDIFMIYEPDIEKLKDLALNLELGKQIAVFSKNEKLVFAPTKYLDQDYLDALRLDYCQLPYEIYESVK